MLKSSELAELIGIVLGDGSLYNGDNYQYQLDIAFNSKDVEYIDFVENLLEKLFNVPIYRKKVSNQNCIHLRICNKEAIEKFVKISSIPFGNKIENNVTIPSWIWDNDDHLSACLRGLIDTDGSLYELLPHWPGLYQISFKNKNMILLRDFRRAFIQLGFNPSKVFGDRVVLTRQDEIRRYLKTLGTNNPKSNSPVV